MKIRDAIYCLCGALMIDIVACKQVTVETLAFSNEYTSDVINALDSISRNSSIEGPVLNINSSHFDMGRVSKSAYSAVEITFDVYNSGDNVLLLTNVEPSCGCMKADYTKAPIEPHNMGHITITVNLRGQKDEFNKSVFVKSNTKRGLDIIRIMGDID